MSALQGVEHARRGGREPAGANAARFAALAGSTGKLRTLAELEPREEPRTPTGIEEFDRVLGGGLVAGGVVLIAARPRDRKIDAVAAGAFAASASSQGDLRQRRGVGRAGRVARATASARSRVACNCCRNQPRTHPRGAEERTSSAHRRHRFDPDRLLRGAAVGARIRRAGARVRRAAHPFAKQSGTSLIMVGT